jgi:L-asparaginase II
MLALARYHGWPVEFYARLEHPVQQRCLAEVSGWTGVAPERIGTAVDGCGVVCFALPLKNMAWAYARLGKGGGGRGKSVVDAMLRHPDLIAGEGRPCTEMIRAHPGRVVAKVGAAGVYCGLLIREGWGIALKVEDGQREAAVLAMVAILAELGLRPQPESLATLPIVNTRGETVGELHVNGGVMRAKDGGDARGNVYDA